VLSLCLVFCTSCSSVQISESEEADAEPQLADLSYRARILHPDSPEIESVRALFAKEGVPDRTYLNKCDFDYRVETMLARSVEELLTTLPEHVRSNPEKYHWCFYSKMLDLEEKLTEMSSQGPAAQRKYLLNQYRFFIYLARVFEVDLDEPRYLDFARMNYKRWISSLKDE